MWCQRKRLSPHFPTSGHKEAAAQQTTHIHSHYRLLYCSPPRWQGWRMEADAQRRTRLCFSTWGGGPEQMVPIKTHTCTSLYCGKWGSFIWVGCEGKPIGRELFLSNDFSCLNFMFTLSHHSPPPRLSNYHCTTAKLHIHKGKLLRGSSLFN